MSGWLRRHSNMLPTLSQVNPPPNGCFGKNGMIVSYGTNVLMEKTTRLPKAKVWIESAIIAVIAEPSNISLNKLSHLMYADDEPHTMRAWNPLSKNKH